LNVCFDSHSSDNLFEKYALGTASSLDVASLEGHLLLCHRCQTRLAEIEDYVAVMRAALLELETDMHAPIGVRSAMAL